MRWQPHDLTFWQLQLRINTPIQRSEGGDGVETGHLNDLFLRQFDHFDLRGSHISFITLLGRRAELVIPQLIWLNGKNWHRAGGQASLSSLTGQHDAMQVRMDLRGDEGLLNNGRARLQADDVDVRSWLGKRIQNNVVLQTACFSLEAWMATSRGVVFGGDVWLRKGEAS